MKGALQPDLSITGRSTSRHERPMSGGGRRKPPSAVRNASTKSNIFGVADTPRGRVQSAPPMSPSVPSTISHYTTPETPRATDGHQNVMRNAGVISKSQLEETKQKLAASENKKAYQRQPADVPVYSSPSRAGRRSAPPVGVPHLNLGNLADDNNKLAYPVQNEGPNLHTPDSGRSDVSWGTPMNSTRVIDELKKAHGTRTQGVPPAQQSKKPSGMPTLDLQKSQDEQELRRAVRNVQEEEKAKKQKLQVEQIVKREDKTRNKSNDEREHWSSQPKSEREWYQQKVKEEQEKHFAEKKKEMIMETVLVDQLSRATVSEPDAVRSPYNTYDMGARERKLMEFHNTRYWNKIKSVQGKGVPEELEKNQSLSTPSPHKSENTLAKRLRFGARIVTKHGHDVHRELNGFFFSADNTLTVYEFRQFGTRSSALPFIQRGSYIHVSGRKKGRPYTLQDIAVGNSLSFITANQSSLPQSVSGKPVVTLRITDLDEEGKDRLLFDGCRSPGDRRAVLESLEKPSPEADQKERQLIEHVQGEVHKQLQKRAAKTLLGMGRHFRQLDKSGDGMLDKEELKEALREYHIKLSPQIFDDLWGVLDVNGDGALDYGEFIRGFIGEMNETRKAYVRKVFHKLDPNKTGVVVLNNMKKFFSAKKHPKVLSGEISEYDAQSAFLSSFEHCENRGEVTYAEFEDYYEGVSIGMSHDQEFVAMMKNCWGC